jgi:hypothetical protein
MAWTVVTSGHSEKRGSFLNQKANWISSIEITTGFFTGPFCLFNSFKIMDFPSYNIITMANIGGMAQLHNPVMVKVISSQ